MSAAFNEYEVLKEATRPRLNKATVEQLRDLAEAYDAGDKLDRRLAHGLTLLLDMHDRLETIRNGQA